MEGYFLSSGRLFPGFPVYPGAFPGFRVRRTQADRNRSRTEMRLPVGAWRTPQPAPPLIGKAQRASFIRDFPTRKKNRGRSDRSFLVFPICAKKHGSALSADLSFRKARSALSEISAANGLIVHQIAGIPRKNNFPCFEDIRAIRGGKRLVCVLLNEQNRGA